LRDDAEVVLGPRRFGHRVEPEDADFTRGREKLGGDLPDQGGLTRAVGAQNA
jgi:hypothetical protein